MDPGSVALLQELEELPQRLQLVNDDALEGKTVCVQ